MEKASTGKIQNQTEQPDSVNEEIKALRKELDDLKSKKASINEPLHQVLSSIGLVSNDSKHQAHNLTVGEMKLLREKQANGEKIDTIPGNKNSSYRVPITEKHLIHVQLEKEEWNRGKKLSKPFVQKFYPNDFNIMQKNILEEGDKNRPQNAFGHYDTVKILHDPRNSEEQKKSEIIRSNPLSGKRLEERSLEELRETYRMVSGEESHETDTVAQLIVMINEASNGGLAASSAI